MMQVTAHACQAKWTQILDSLSFPSRLRKLIEVKMPSAINPRKPMAIRVGCHENRVPTGHVASQAVCPLVKGTKVFENMVMPLELKEACIPHYKPKKFRQKAAYSYNVEVCLIR